MIQPVILSGGIGSRLWPLSRSLFPKQFVHFKKNISLFKETLKRALDISDTKTVTPFVITNKSQRKLAMCDLSDLNRKAYFIFEPVQRSTAAAICAAAYIAKDSDPVLIVLPSDQLLIGKEEFQRKVKIANKLALEGKLVTFGIIPSRPETGYGYIKLGKELENSVFEIDKFIEKPEVEVAEKLLLETKCLWNSGIFVFKASALLREMAIRKPEIYQNVKEAIEYGERFDGEIYLNEDKFSRCENISIDYAIFEKTGHGITIPLDLEWSDLGTWQSMYLSETKDENNNVINGDVLSVDTRNSYIKSTNRLVATIGVKNLAIVESRDSILISALDQSQKVKNIVEILSSQGRSEADVNAFVNRPWGGYESLIVGERFQVKRIIVDPGEELSLQKHFHRAEHWIVVQGSAEIINDDKKELLTENQSTYIPIGVKHKLANPGKIPLIVIEVQSGSYLGEDDILRLSDKYNRN